MDICDCDIGIIRPHLTQSMKMVRPIATDGLSWSVCLLVCVFVCLLDTLVSPAKMAEPIDAYTTLLVWYWQ